MLKIRKVFYDFRKQTSRLMAASNRLDEATYELTKAAKAFEDKTEQLNAKLDRLESFEKELNLEHQSNRLMREFIKQVTFQELNDNVSV